MDNDNRYKYNTETLEFELIQTTKWERILKFLKRSVINIIIAILISVTFFFDSPNEKRLEIENASLKHEVVMIKKHVLLVEDKLGQLEHKDKNIYSAIFEIPIDSLDSIRYYKNMNMQYLTTVNTDSLLKFTSKRLNYALESMHNQDKSYERLLSAIKNKGDMLSHIPSISPVSGDMLEAISSGYGYRIDPIYKVKKFHHGLDFVCPIGSPIYATGNGKVIAAGNYKDGMGNKIVIDHGYNFKTIYAHLERITVKKGDHIVRGDTIGIIGNTGKSTGLHLHYEVRKHNKSVDPVNYFYNDITPEEYYMIVHKASIANQSLD